MRWETLSHYAKQHQNIVFEAFAGYKGSHTTDRPGCAYWADWVEFLDAMRKARAIPPILTGKHLAIAWSINAWRETEWDVNRKQIEVLAMTQLSGTYSDWRTIAPMDRCPRCGGTQLRSRDGPTGLEVECTSGCGYREVLIDFTREDFDRWMQRVRSQRS